MPQPEPAEKSPLAQASVGETGASCLDRTAMSASGVTPQLQHCVPTIPDHELIRRIGSGSYGEVWLARSVMGTFRAVKVVYRKTFEHILSTIDRTIGNLAACRSSSLSLARTRAW